MGMTSCYTVVVRINSLDQRRNWDCGDIFNNYHGLLANMVSMCYLITKHYMFANKVYKDTLCKFELKLLIQEYRLIEEVIAKRRTLQLKHFAKGGGLLPDKGIYRLYYDHLKSASPNPFCNINDIVIQRRS